MSSTPRRERSAHASSASARPAEAPLSPAGGGSPIRHRTVSIPGLDVHLAEAGEGPLVLLLHGFPEFWYAWRRQLPALAAGGFHAAAPDLRGYGRTSRPEGVESYRLDLLVEDVARLLEALDGGDTVLVGHDWGGVIAWYVAMRYPHLVGKLAILNAPHPATYARELRRFSSQILRSWYAGFFQLPWVPEAAWRARDFALLRRVVRSGPAPDAVEAQRYVDAFSGPGALTSAINYYRAALRFAGPEVVPIQVPTLLIWGERDPFLVPRLTHGLDGWIDDLRIERLPHADHWLHHRNADEVNRLLLHFAGSGTSLSGGRDARGSAR